MQSLAGCGSAMESIIRNPVKYLALSNNPKNKRGRSQNVMPPFDDYVVRNGEGVHQDLAVNQGKHVVARAQFKCSQSVYRDNKQRAGGSSVFDLLYMRQHGQVRKDDPDESFLGKCTMSPSQLHCMRSNMQRSPADSWRGTMTRSKKSLSSNVVDESGLSAGELWQSHVRSRPFTSEPRKCRRPSTPATGRSQAMGCQEEGWRQQLKCRSESARSLRSSGGRRSMGTNETMQL